MQSLREIDLEHVNVRFDQSHEDENSELDDEGGTIFIAPKDLSSEPTRISVGNTEERVRMKGGWGERIGDRVRRKRESDEGGVKMRREGRVKMRREGEWR